MTRIQRQRDRVAVGEGGFEALYLVGHMRGSEGCQRLLRYGSATDLVKGVG